MHIYNPFIRQVARFGAELEAGVIYEFETQFAKSLKPLAVLREPDYDTRSWKRKQGEQAGAPDGDKPPK